jgi:ACS family glucarate transporter-like MFS transporter
MSKRYAIVGITAVAALWMYIDRVCFSTLTKSIKTDLGMTDDQKADILGAFFLTYALCQIPIGALADRYGPRLVLTIAIAAWSAVTACTGFATSFHTLLAIRLLLGITEAGAYPAAAGLVKNWTNVEERGRFSSIVAFGGRLGGAIAPKMTAGLAILLIGFGFTAWSNPSGVNWRGVFALYGLCGLVVAALFWFVVRDRPDHSLTAPNSRQSFWQELWPLIKTIGNLARNRTMWLFGFVQLGVNIGWAFLVTLLPDYLDERFHVALEDIGLMQSVILTTGCVGMIVGGLTTDWYRHFLGPRWGRAVPLGLTLTGCATLCYFVSVASDPWMVTALLSAMAFLVDLGIPCIWAFAQDVGGRKVGAALGWGNMWGNLAAWQSPIILTQVKNTYGWDTAFVVCGCFFVAAAICGLLLNATKPVYTGENPESFV